MQIATNLVNDFYRKRGSTGHAWSIEEGELDPVGGGDPAELVLDLFSVQEAVAAMSSLTELERDVIQLRYTAELSIAETAAALGKSDNNVKQLTFKALGKLRKVMSQQDAGNPQA
jgi:RNA polymerase sigma-70 factor (ECF subfamily)